MFHKKSYGTIANRYCYSILSNYVLIDKELNH